MDEAYDISDTNILPKAAMPKIYANFEYIPLLPFDPELLAHLFFKPPATMKKAPALFHSLTKFLLDTNSSPYFSVQTTSLTSIRSFFIL